MTMNFSDLFPAIQPVLEGLAQVPLIKHINETVWIFALVETGHLLFLTLLGGAVFALNLRILGLILPDVTTQDVERAIRPWYLVGVIGSLATGIAMGITTARTLLPSGAFFVKMVALVAAILLSNIIAQDVRDDRSASRRAGITRLTAALGMWFFALFLFVSTEGLNSGGMLIALAGGALLAAAAQRRHRPMVVGLSAAVLGIWFFGVDALIGSEEGQHSAWLTHGLALAVIAPALGISVQDIKGGVDQKDVTIKLTAFASTLAWVTVAAAGRWIGFS